MMDLLAWFSRSQCEFVNGSETAVLRSYLIAGGLPVPKCQQIQSWYRKIFTAPRYVDANDINVSLSDLWETRNHVDKVLESANIT
jgi:hypothetical protein